MDATDIWYLSFQLCHLSNTKNTDATDIWYITTIPIESSVSKSHLKKKVSQNQQIHVNLSSAQVSFIHNKISGYTRTEIFTNTQQGYGLHEVLERTYTHTTDD